MLESRAIDSKRVMGSNRLVGHGKRREMVPG